ncbi:uncharacterized protein LOC143895693 [Temnothorax americanus]|uniref:uncharacterized protein LOC143895693 n=1 Tax=Temnothorax americanus TaxID=1964332 RepID=UPI0040690F94
MTRGLTSFIIRAQSKDDIRFPIEATVLPRITSPLPSNRVESKSWNHLRGLPLADPEYYLPGSIDVLLGAESFVSDYLDSGHMELVSDPFPVDGRVYYLPHHGVYKLDSTTTKLCVVFDASSKCPNGLSLNDTLISSPKLQPDIVAVLLLFRAEPVAITADVKQMFRQIWIHPEHLDYQRIVWRFSESDPILDYLLKTVTFGTTASPFLAIYCLLKLAYDHRDQYPFVYATLLESLYVDDVVASVRTVEKVIAFRDQLLELFRSAGFELQKWASSHPAALEGLDPAMRSQRTLSFESTEDRALKVLRGHLDIDKEYAWSDAKVVLYWIFFSPHRWKTFVCNCVARIQEKTAVSAWGHVATELNPANHCSRGLFSRELVATSMWWRGPKWLIDFESRTEPVLDKAIPYEEERIVTLVAHETPNVISLLLNRYLSLDKISRIIAYIIRFTTRSRAKPVPATLGVDQFEAHLALLAVVKLVQLESFGEEID